jgi:mono/diheme cytochrome c family protein
MFKRSMIQNLSYLSALSIVLAGCNTDDSKSPMTNTSDQTVYYDSDIKEIISTNCTSCHSGSNPQSGLDLSNLSTLKSIAVSNTGESSLLLNVLKGQNGAPLMPTSGAISTEDIALIEQWIGDGLFKNKIEEENGVSSIELSSVGNSVANSSAENQLSSQTSVSSSDNSTDLSSSILSSTATSSIETSSSALSSQPASSTPLSSTTLSSTALSSQAKLITYTTDIAPILNTNCTKCHGKSGGVSLKDYTSAKNKADRILFRTENGTMPAYPNPSLTTSEIQLIKDWIAAGTPE